MVKIATRSAIAILCGFVTVQIIGSLHHLPYSPLLVTLVDVLLSPGAFIGFLVYPQGVHTGKGAPN
jgi:hypothetical protein